MNNSINFFKKKKKDLTRTFKRQCIILHSVGLLPVSAVLMPVPVWIPVIFTYTTKYLIHISWLTVSLSHSQAVRSHTNNTLSHSPALWFCCLGLVPRGTAVRQSDLSVYAFTFNHLWTLSLSLLSPFTPSPRLALKKALVIFIVWLYNVCMRLSWSESRCSPHGGTGKYQRRAEEKCALLIWADFELKLSILKIPLKMMTLKWRFIELRESGWVTEQEREKEIQRCHV